MRGRFYVGLIVLVVGCARASGTDRGFTAATATATDHGADAGSRQELLEVELQLADRAFKPCPGAPYRVTLPSGAVKAGRTDAEGLVHLQLPAGLQALHVEYTPEGQQETMTVDATVNASKEPDESDAGYVRRMRGLGFGAGGSDKFVILKFQDSNPPLRRTGKVDADTKSVLRRLEGTP
jgi:hypothetical protein